VLGTKYPVRFLSAAQNVPGEFLPATAERILTRQFPVKRGEYPPPRRNQAPGRASAKSSLMFVPYEVIMVLGGLIGFAIGFGFSWAQGSPWPSVLWRACDCGSARWNPAPLVGTTLDPVPQPVSPERQAALRKNVTLPPRPTPPSHEMHHSFPPRDRS